jgi:hypothetical protein
MNIQNRYQLSLSRILWLDYPAFNAVLFPVVLLAITGILAVIDYRGLGQADKAGAISGTTQAVFYVAIFLSLICVPLVILRIKIFWSIWKEGIEIPGKITQTVFLRDRGQIYFTYRHKEYEYKARIVVHKTRQTTSVRKEDKVTLVISPKDPKQVFIRDFYLKEKP